MTTIGLRELRQDASGIIRRVENGEEITVTVSGRPSARLVPSTGPSRWRTWDDIDDLVHGGTDPAWSEQRDLVDHAPADPWDRG